MQKSDFNKVAKQLKTEKRRLFSRNSYWGGGGGGGGAASKYKILVCLKQTYFVSRTHKTIPH